MLLTIAIILLILWALGFFAFHVAGALIHILLVIGDHRPHLEFRRRPPRRLTSLPRTPIVGALRGRRYANRPLNAPCMTNSISTRVAVLGSGPAGLYRRHLCRARRPQPIVIQGIQPGGQLTTTTDVENYPGFRDVIQGPWLMEEMQAQAEHVGTKIVWDHIARSTCRAGRSG